jgi:hypothetical protein
MSELDQARQALEERLATLRQDGRVKRIKSLRPPDLTPCSECQQQTPPGGLERADQFLEVWGQVSQIRLMAGPDVNDAYVCNATLGLLALISMSLGACERCANAGLWFDHEGVAALFYARALVGASAQTPTERTPDAD